MAEDFRNRPLLVSRFIATKMSDPERGPEVRLHPAFREVYRTIWAQLRGEVLRAYGAQGEARARGGNV